jgi:uncharacterized protein (DUF58 family)
VKQTVAFLKTALKRLSEHAREESSRSVWKNFATAIGLLAIAMLSALYSSSVARGGRMVQAAASATLALVIAIWVGIRFVPRLAANVEWDWLPFRSQYHVTREGWIYLGGVVIVVFAAVNTNNNLLYMVLSALIAVLLLSGFLSALNFRRLRIDLRVPPHCFAGQPFPISIQVRNNKLMFPSFSLNVENTDRSGLLFQPFFAACVRAQEQTDHNGEATLQYRGRYEVRSVKILSGYPFGFFQKGKECAVNSTCLCYPEILPQEQLNLSAVDILGSNQRFERGLGNDLYMIRDYLPSDSARHVHWKASAKTATLKTREFAADESHRLSIQLDRFAHVHQTREFEHLVSWAASAAMYLIRDAIEVSVVTDEWISGHGASDAHLEKILNYLAVVQRSNSIGVQPADSGQGTIVLSLRHRKAVAV